MITAAQIRDLRHETVDYDETARLKARLATLRQKRCPFYLTLEEFDEILRWKLGQQYARQRSRRADNTDAIIRAVTSLALTITHHDPDYQLELRVGVLTALRGVGVPVASAVLALIYPDEYAVIDYRGWRQVFDKEQSVFSISDYKRYMREMRRLAVELGWPVQEVDHAIWEFDRRWGRPGL